MLIRLARKLCLDIAAGHAAVMALEANRLLSVFHQTLRYLRSMRTMTALTPITAYARVTGVRALKLGITQVFTRIGRMAVH